MIYTAKIGQTDPLQSLPPCDAVAFTDQVVSWPFRYPQIKHSRGPIWTARWHKLHAAVLFPGRSVVWSDANCRWLRSPAPLLSLVTQDKPLAFFRHTQRACLYAEADACRELKKPGLSGLDAQLAAYRDAGMPENFGLWETTAFVCHPAAYGLLAAWWSQVDQYSSRDQVSLPYVIWRLKAADRITDLSGSVHANDYFTLIP
jgi:O-antigen biosynthesis protein